MVHPGRGVTPPLPPVFAASLAQAALRKRAQVQGRCRGAQQPRSQVHPSQRGDLFICSVEVVVGKKTSRVTMTPVVNNVWAKPSVLHKWVTGDAETLLPSACGGPHICSSQRAQHLNCVPDSCERPREDGGKRWPSKPEQEVLLGLRSPSRAQHPAWLRMLNFLRCRGGWGWGKRLCPT